MVALLAHWSANCACSPVRYFIRIKCIANIPEQLQNTKCSLHECQHNRAKQRNIQAHCKVIAPQTTEIKIDIHLIYTPFGPIIGKKQYSFSSKNGPKGVLLFPDFQSKRSASLKKKNFKNFKLALLLLQKSSKRSTPFAPKIDQKEYSF